MILQEQSTEADRLPIRSRDFYGLTLRDGLKFISSLILPLMLGIFTVVITIHQQNAVAKQRAEDRNATRLQRDQELVIAKNLSDANKELATAHKEQEKERYQNDILVAYIKEMGELLKDNGGSLTSNPVTTTPVRVKTLNIFRQVDPLR
ncbi:unnamed protein product [Didymodactylos carnosus]|uniref:Uncharacterized protein n=1 Tax=Didymodactylos carnosus TaxID=1234261 RepID=A0A815G9I8_9BILA|nr:unnamed protein product [Didymodactylos carnosus]CAF1335893.1 unnamed protein product [Didymodactylos carnosus]CAF4002449.1 unnamed protein product [Didymodactylos carnosus]CAF4193033.1 unnamed protein product [Didymodactylos carnosus]